MLKLHEWCKDNGNIKHQPYLTGTAYSVILAAKHNGLENKSGAVHNSCHYVAKKLDILTDMSVTDISRITRIPNTFNFKETAKRYVIPLKEDQLYLGDEAIREIAKKQQFGVKPIGDGAFDISKFDCVREYRNDLSMPEFDEKDIVDMDINLGRVPACIKRMLAEPELGYKARPILIIWLRDKGLLLQETISILKKTLSDRKFKHCVFEEKQPQKMYQRIMSMYMPRCDTIAGQGYCNCKSENECGLK